MLESLGSDLRFGARPCGKARAFSAIAIITLALGVGASTAIFSVIDNILLEPFPYPQAQRLMSLEIHNTDESNPGGRGAFSGATLRSVPQISCRTVFIISNGSPAVRTSTPRAAEPVTGNTHWTTARGSRDCHRSVCEFRVGEVDCQPTMGRIGGTIR